MGSLSHCTQRHTFYDYCMKNRDLTTKDNKHGQQKESIDKFEKARVDVPGYDLDACLSNT